MSKISAAGLTETFQWRYATKVFDPSKKLSSENWEALKEALRLTPSSFGLQPWHFLAITDAEIRKELLPHSWNQTQVTDCSHYLVLCTRTDLNLEFVDSFIDSIAQQRDVSVELLTEYRGMMVGLFESLSEEHLQHWATRQTYLALQRLTDAAALLGIDACPIEGFTPPEYNQILKLPEKSLTASVCCALGYRSEKDKYASLAKVREPMENILTEL